MSDAHLRILRAAARRRRQQLDADRAGPGEMPPTSRARRARLQELAARAQDELSRARDRRRPDPTP